MIRLMLAFLLLLTAWVAPSGAQVKAFPTAEGFGANAIGGRGGRIVFVTSLADSGPGTLRDAIAVQTGPRIILFRVSGTIQLQSTIWTREPYITIAGQTSPGGIQIRTTPGIATGIWFLGGSHNIIVRHLRVRMGGPAPDDAGEPMIVYGDNASLVHDVIFDHISYQWGTDTQYMAYGNVDNTTLQWSIISEGAQSDISTGKGTHILSSKHSDHHNLYVSNQERNPLVQRAETFDVRNIIVYNCDNGPMDLGSFAINTSARGNVVNNHFINGPNQRSGPISGWLQNGGPTRVGGGNADQGGTKIYSSGNWSPRFPTGSADDWDMYRTSDFYYGLVPAGDIVVPDQATFRVSVPFTVPAVTTYPTGELKNRMLSVIGAYKPSRDSVDTRVVNDVINGTGPVDLVAAIGTGGPWAALSGGPFPPDTDNDGMPDTWEIAQGLNPNNANDGPATATNGYTNVENYLNQLAGDGDPPPPVPTPTLPPPKGFRKVASP